MRDMIDLLDNMARKDASDLYLVAGAPLQIKIDGVTHPVADSMMSQEKIRELVYGIMTDKQQRTLEAELECNFAISVPELGRYRVNIYYQRGQISVVVRYLKSHIPDIEELNLPPILKNLVLEPRGLFLAVGSTGSGKSTTLASMIQHRSRLRTGHILTIEDPIEYVHVHDKSIISQREVGLDTLNYDNALKNAMREAPDVIMIGEIRDSDTMRQAIAYADTGHLCLSTLHANNAYQALERIVNFFPETARNQVLDDVAMNIRGIFSQRLMKGLDGKRRPACELMLPSPYIVDLIQKGEFESVRDTMEHSIDAGMLTFEQSVFEAYSKGKISREEAIRNVDSKANLETRIRLAKMSSDALGDDFSLDEDNLP